MVPNEEVTLPPSRLPLHMSDMWRGFFPVTCVHRIRSAFHARQEYSLQQKEGHPAAVQRAQHELVRGGTESTAESPVYAG